MRKLIPLVCLAAGVVIGSVGITPALAQHDQHISRNGTTPMAKNPSASTMLMQCMDKSMAAMKKMKPSGNVDHDFAQLMAEHHKGAMDMSAVEIKYGKDAKLKAMAKKMVAAQKRERATLMTHEHSH